MGSVYGCANPERGLWGALLERLVHLSGGPHSEAGSWPEKGTPLGIVNDIPEGGVFPKVEADDHWQEGDKEDSLAE